MAESTGTGVTRGKDLWETAPIKNLLGANPTRRRYKSVGVLLRKTKEQLVRTIQNAQKEAVRLRDLAAPETIIASQDDYIGNLQWLLSARRVGSIVTMGDLKEMAEDKTF